VDNHTPPRHLWWRRKAIVIPAALLVVAVIVGAIVITSRHENSHGAHIAPPNSTQYRASNRTCVGCGTALYCGSSPPARGSLRLRAHGLATCGPELVPPKSAGIRHP
jgi:hypothetical protein